MTCSSVSDAPVLGKNAGLEAQMVQRSAGLPGAYRQGSLDSLSVGEHEANLPRRSQHRQLDTRPQQENSRTREMQNRG
jgi:hypothetical protein